MTYCEQKLNAIYQNFKFSYRVYDADAHLLRLLYNQALERLTHQLTILKEAHYPYGELTFYGNHYRRLITQYYNSQALA